MIVEMALTQLIANTERIETKKRHHIADQVQIQSGYKLEIVDKDSLVALAITQTGHHPAIRIPFRELEGSGVIIVTADGEEHRIDPAKMSSDDVQVSCDCDDFFYRFATQNAKSDVLFGSITRQPYISKTGKTRNVQHIDQPAVCKHIIKLTHLLRANQILR